MHAYKLLLFVNVFSHLLSAANKMTSGVYRVVLLHVGYMNMMHVHDQRMRMWICVSLHVSVQASCRTLTLIRCGALSAVFRRTMVS